MKKGIALAFAGMVMLAGGLASAERVETPIGTVGVNEGGYVVYADGNAGNPDPIDGYAGVKSSGQVCADDNGGPTDPNNPGGTSPTCAP